MILDQFGRQYPTRKRPEKRPLAAAPVLDGWRDYVAAGLTPQRLTAIFQEADSGDVSRQAQLFAQLEEKDGHLLGEVTKRKNAVLDIDYQVTPASDDRRDVKVAEFVKGYLDNAADFEDILVSLQDAVGKGFAGLEIHWDTSEGQSVPRDLEFIEPKRFLFTDPKGYLRKTPLLLTDDNTMGMELPPWKVLLHRYGGKSGHPTRSGILRVCSWWYLFKNYAAKDWVAFCEIFGIPLRLGKYEAGATDADREALVTAISSLGSDAAGIISKSTEIEFVKAEGSTAHGDLFEGLAQFGNREMSKAILGQTLTAEIGGTGSYAASQTHNDVRLDLAKADTRAVGATLRYQLIRPIVGFNFGWDTPVPGYGPVWEEEEDLKGKSDWVTALLDRGVEMPLSFVRREFNIPEPEKGEPVVGGMAKPDPVAAKYFPAGFTQAKTDPMDGVDEMADKAAEKANAPMDVLLKPVISTIGKNPSFEEVGERLHALYPNMDSARFQEILRRAMSAAGLEGYGDAS